MRIVYFGSPQIAVGPLEALHDAGHQIVLVVTGQDKRRGRGSTTTPTPVKASAANLGIPVSSEMSDVMDVDADLGVVVAYGRIIPTGLLERMPMVNIHFSLLPRWRGAAPVERAILAGDETTGVCLMEVVPDLDAGGVFEKAEIPIEATDTADALRDKLSLIGTKMLLEALENGLGTPVPQDDSGATYAEKITVADRFLNGKLNVAEFLARVRIGGAWTTFRDRRLKILAATNKTNDELGDFSVHEPGTLTDDAEVVLPDGIVTLLRVQPEGKGIMSGSDWARGARPAGERIES